MGIRRVGDNPKLRNEGVVISGRKVVTVCILFMSLGPLHFSALRLNSSCQHLHLFPKGLSQKQEKIPLQGRLGVLGIIAPRDADIQNLKFLSLHGITLTCVLYSFPGVSHGIKLQFICCGSRVDNVHSVYTAFPH